MMISTRGRYALRVMIDLAEHVGVSYIPLKDIAERQQISEKISGVHRESIGAERPARRPPRQGRRLPLKPRPRGYTVGNILRLTEAIWPLSPVLRKRLPASAPPPAAPCPCGRNWIVLSTNSLTATHSRISPRPISPAMTLSSEQIRPPHACRLSCRGGVFFE